MKKTLRPLKYLGIIPARGGSKGIPRKNIKLIAGKPLIAWSIESARQSQLLDRFIVSTEDAEIAAISREYGAEILERPMTLATDEATTLSVLRHALENVNAENIVLLQPTSPVRDDELIDSCIKRFEETGVNNLATGFICKFKEYGSYSKRRQELDGFFYDDGNVYVIKADMIKKGTLHSEQAECFEITREQNTEIDNDFDFWLAEQILFNKAKVGSHGN